MESFVLNLAGYLCRRGDIEVRVCFKLVEKCRVTGDFQRQLDIAEVPYAIVARGSLALLRQIGWADLVHGHNTSPDICLLSRILGKRLVLTIYYNMIDRRGLRVWVWKAAARLAARRWYISRFVRGSWETSPESRTSEAFPVISKIERTFAPLSQRRGFVFVARMIPNKGADLLLEAYSRAGLDPQQWPLRMVGDGPLRPQLAARYGNVPGVRFDGFVSDAQKQEIIAGARWMVTPPNTREDMGLTPIEARSQGVPCIASRDGGVPEVAGSEALLCAPGSVEQLKACLVEAAAFSPDEYARRAQLAHDGVKTLLRPFDWYVSSYLDVLGIERSEAATC